MEMATLAQGTKIHALFKDVPREQVQALLASGLLADVRDANHSRPIDRDAVRELLGLAPISPPLLETVDTVTVPVTTESFVVNERFVLGGNLPKIVYLGSNFEGWFGSKTEGSMVQTELCYARLAKTSVDGPILAELGENAETTLAQVRQLLELQSNGQEGALLTNGWINIFYVRDVNDTLRAVSVYWDYDGWSVDASSVENPDMWGDGNRVFSRSS